MESVVESEVSLTESQSDLRRAADIFCDTSKDAKWATGQSSLSYLMRLWDGEVEPGQDYWENINTLDMDTKGLKQIIDGDIQSATRQLQYINSLAQKLLPAFGAEDKPKKSDVNEFERVVIHAGQSRETFNAAYGRLVEAEESIKLTYVAEKLSPFDVQLDTARSIANDLASARMSEVMAELETGPKS
jgi:hypothetical protein